MRSLLARLLARNRGFLTACALLLGGFQFILCAIVSSLNIESALEQVLAFAPPLFRGLIEQSLLGGSTAGILAFGWNHPITHALITAVSITLAARAVAGEIENGAIELVLTQPLSREAYLASHVIIGVASIAIVASAGVLGTVVGQHVFGLQSLGPARVMRLLINLVLLQSVIYAVTLIVSAWAREAGRVAVVGVFVVVVSYLVNVVATLWPQAAFLHAYSLHSYYDPRAILVKGDLLLSSILLLGGSTIACFAVAFWRFGTRDLP